MVRSNGIYMNEECTRKLGRISNERDRFNHDIFEDLILERTSCNPCRYLVRSDVFFQIYPNRKIYESKEGQNWQMLVPISSITKCGYIDEDLCYIVVRKDSHSRKERNYNERLSRINGLEEILLEALKHSKCDYNKYKKIVQQKYIRQRLYVSIEFRDKEAVKYHYHILKNHNWNTIFDFFHYLRGISPFFNYIYIAFRFPFKVSKKIYNKLMRNLFNKKRIRYTN